MYREGYDAYICARRANMNGPSQAGGAQPSTGGLSGSQHFQHGISASRHMLASPSGTNLNVPLLTRAMGATTGLTHRTRTAGGDVGMGLGADREATSPVKAADYHALQVEAERRRNEQRVQFQDRRLQAAVAASHLVSQAVANMQAAKQDRLDAEKKKDKSNKGKNDTGSGTVEAIRKGAAGNNNKGVAAQRRKGAAGGGSSKKRRGVIVSDDDDHDDN